MSVYTDTFFSRQDLVSDLLIWFWVFKANVHIKKQSTKVKKSLEKMVLLT